MRNTALILTLCILALGTAFSSPHSNNHFNSKAISIDTDTTELILGLKNEASTLQQRIDVLENEYSARELELKSAEENILQLNLKIEGYESSVTSLKEKNTTLNESNTNLQKTLDISEKNENDCQLKLVSHEDEKLQLNAKNKLLTSKIENLEVEFIQATNEKDKAISDHAILLETQAILNQSQEELQQEIAVQNKNSDDLKNEITIHSKKLIEKEQEIDSQKNQLSDSKVITTQLSNQLEELNQELIGKQKENEDLVHQNKQVTTDYVTLKSDQDIANSEIAELTKSISKYQAELSDLQLSHKQYIKYKEETALNQTNLDLTIQNLQTENSNYINEIAQLKKTLEQEQDRASLIDIDKQ